MRKWILAVALMLTVPMVGAAAVINVPAEQEQLVEGHTVFAVVQTRVATAEAREQFAAAVAILIRENIAQVRYPDRFPGVLWFNDQYLVAPTGGSVVNDPNFQTRYPCGAVIAVNQGDPVPLDNGVPHVPSWAVYNESYRITDPHNTQWIIDKWRYDRDTTNADVTDISSMWSVATVGSTAVHYAQGDTATGSASCSRALTGPSNLKYNALLFFFLDDLTSFGGIKNHNTNPTGDTNGCQPNTYGNAWPCPGGDDDREGYSHSFNTGGNWPLTQSAGRGNHGGSTGCGANPDGTFKGGGPQGTHATCNVDIYFGKVNATVPITRNWRIQDFEGSTAPFHCHDDTMWCSQQDALPGV